MMEIIIKNLEETSYNLKDIYIFIQDVYQERVRQGIIFSVSNYSYNEFFNEIEKEKGKFIVALNRIDGTLVGCASYFVKNNKRGNLYAKFRHVAVNPSAQRTGVGKLLSSYIFEIVSSIGCEYVLSSTAVSAKSSVIWHQKRGYKIVGLRSFKSNYYSYIFRYQIKPSVFWENCLFVKLIFLYSYIKTKVIYKENGDFRSLFKMIKKTK